MRLEVRFAAVLLAAALAAAAGTARAENARPVQLAITQGFRLAVLSPFDHRYVNVLAAYGYGTMPNYYEIVAVDGSYAVRKWLEFGGHFNYALGYGGATDTPQGSGMFLHEIELGGVARVVIGNHDQDARGGIGIEVGGGIAIPSLSLRGTAKGTPAPYLAPGVAVWLPAGRGRIQGMFRARYVIANYPNAFGPGIDLPLGGLVLTGGINISI